MDMHPDKGSIHKLYVWGGRPMADVSICLAAHNLGTVPPMRKRNTDSFAKRTWIAGWAALYGRGVSSVAGGWGLYSYGDGLNRVKNR